MTFETIDKQSFPPYSESGEFVVFVLKAKLGTYQVQTSVQFKMIDPCYTCQLSLASTFPLRDDTYFLRDRPLTYEWTKSSFLAKDTPVDCGALIVEIFNADGSEFDTNIFELDQNKFSNNKFQVLYSEDLSIQSVYELSFRAYFENFEAFNTFEAQETFSVTILNPCESPYSLVEPS